MSDDDWPITSCSKGWTMHAITNPISEAQGFLADYQDDSYDYEVYSQPEDTLAEIHRAARIINALLRTIETDNRYHRMRTESLGTHLGTIRRRPRRDRTCRLRRAPCGLVAVAAMRIRPIFAWYDLWIGVYIDHQKRSVYLFPIPCFGIRIDIGPDQLPSGKRVR